MKWIAHKGHSDMIAWFQSEFPLNDDDQAALTQVQVQREIVRRPLTLTSSFQTRSFDFLKERTESWTLFPPAGVRLSSQQTDGWFALALEDGHLDCLDWVISWYPITREDILSSRYSRSIQVAIDRDHSQVLRWLVDAFDLDSVDFARFDFNKPESQACLHWLLHTFGLLNPDGF